MYVRISCMHTYICMHTYVYMHAYAYSTGNLAMSGIFPGSYMEFFVYLQVDAVLLLKTVINAIP